MDFDPRDQDPRKTDHEHIYGSRWGEDAREIKSRDRVPETREHDPRDPFVRSVDLPSGTERELRAKVIFSLSQRRNDAAAVDKLVEIARKETDPELRKQALFWLGQSRDPRAAAILEEIINKP